MTKTAIVYTSAEDSAAAAIDLCTQITRALEGETPDVVVLFASPRFDHPALLSGYGQESDRVKSRAAGCDEHLVKPVDLSALARVLKA